MKQPYRHRVNQREFLNLPGFHEGAYVMAYVEDTSERGLERYEDTGNPYNPRPCMLLQIADCDSHISLEFDVSSPHRRMNSFHKIQTLIDALEAFRAGMAEESILYKRREREGRRIHAHRTTGVIDMRAFFRFYGDRGLGLRGERHRADFW